MAACYDVNLDGTFLGCKYAFPLLRKKGGAIVNLSSVLGMVGGPNLVAYSASKGGVSLLTKSVALHGARYQPPVRCNAVCPAFIEGQMVDEVVRGSRDAKLVRKNLPPIFRSLVWDILRKLLPCAFIYCRTNQLS